MAGTHLPEKWRAYADTMRDGLSTRRAAERIDVDHQTAWRWRHKVLAFLTPEEQPALSGIVEADETYFRRNFTGSNPRGPACTKARDPHWQRAWHRGGHGAGRRGTRSSWRHAGGAIAWHVVLRGVGDGAPADPAAHGGQGPRTIHRERVARARA